MWWVGQAVWPALRPHGRPGLALSLAVSETRAGTVSQQLASHRPVFFSIFFLFLAGSALDFLHVQKKNVESHFSVVFLSFLRLSGDSVALVCSV